ncbi:hypothetical protein RhiirA4_462308 [Rhizophagus irregularis]|uniref:Uncharacterized protein n=1 Tax=Rhizophagus irregularis TaxID=588596 RepID=A0A2I1GKP6_9GLOM|nr:hypothetical protein RhiirA4_462308 [Rhizophagus irregularis]
MNATQKKRTQQTVLESSISTPQKSSSKTTQKSKEQDIRLSSCRRLTNSVNLRKDDSIVTNLGAFVRQAVKRILIAQNNNEDTQAIIKKCDEYTIDKNSN